MATNSLGRLTLDLAVRLSEFTDGLTRAERETRDRTENMGKSVSKFKDQLIEDLSGTPIGGAIDSLNEQLGSISDAFGKGGLAGAAAVGAASVAASVAVMGAGLVTLALQTAEADEQLVRLATRANTSTQNLQVLTAATKSYGLEMEGVGDILADAQEKLGEFSATGGGGLVDTLELMQEATNKTDAELEIFGKSLSTMDSVDAIQAVVDEMELAGATTQEVRFVTESLASGLGDIIPLWDNNGEALRNYERDLNEAGVIRTKESIEQSKILANEVEGLKINFEGVRNELVTEALPAMATLIEYFKEGTKQGGSFKDEVSGVGQAINIAAASVVGIAAGLELLVNAFSAVGMQMRNIGQTAQNFYAAETWSDRGKALFTGFFSAGALASGSMLDISSQWANEVETINKLLDGASSKMNKINTQRPAINNSFGSVLDASGSNVAFPYKNNGIPYRNGAVDAEIKATRALADAEEKEAKAKEKQAKATDKLTKAQARLVGISGDTGIGSAHLHVQYRDKSRAVSAADLARFQVGGKNVTDYAKTSGYGPRNTGIKGASKYHRGTDFAVPKNTKITTTVPVKNVKTWLDKKGGGYVSTIAFEDGVTIDLLHQMPGIMGLDKGSSTGDSSIDSANSKAAAMQQKAVADALRQQEEAEAEALRVQEQLQRDRLSLASDYATEKEKIEADHANKVANIKRLYAEDDTNRQKYLDRQNAAYQEDLDNFKFASQAKAREQDKLYQSIANSARAGGINALSAGKDSMMQRTLNDEDYQQWRLNQDYVEGFDSINDQYKSRESEINAVDERGNYALPELERFELLEIAKQEHLDKMWALEQEYALRDKTLAEQQAAHRVSLYQGLFGSIAGLTKAFAGEQSGAYRVMFAIERGFAIAQSVMAIQQSIAKAMSIGFPANIPIMAQTAAQGAQILTSIKSVQSPVAGIAHGGLTNVPEEATYLLQRDERVLSPNQNKDLVDFMNKGATQGNITINNNSSAEVSARRQPNGEVTIDMVDKMIEKSFRRIGRANSLESKSIQRHTTARVKR